MRNYFWGSTISMSWLWGLGFFFAIHFAQTYGWPGLLLFALPNALGLYLFGFGLDRLQNDCDLRTWIEKKMASSPLLFLSYQVAAISLTIFALLRYLVAETGTHDTVMWGLAVLSAAMLSAELLGIRGTVRLHGLYYAVAACLIAAIVVLAPLPAARPSRAAYDLTFAGFFIPLVAGLLIGPWLDLQQWQRALAIKEAGTSIRRGYAFGAGLFLAILLAVGGLSIVFVPADLHAVLSPSTGVCTPRAS